MPTKPPPSRLTAPHDSREVPVYSITEPMLGGLYDLPLDPYQFSRGWSYIEPQLPVSSHFGLYQGSEDLLDYPGLEVPPLDSCSPASSTGMTLGVPTPSTGHITCTSPRSSAQPLVQPSDPQDSRVLPPSTASLSPALSSDIVRQSPKSDKNENENPRRRSTSAPEGRNKPRRRTHNAIEKRYRTRLNDKITELRDRIPGLGAQPVEASGGHLCSTTTGESSPQKINKAHILEKATEYIQHLETCNRQLQMQLDHQQQVLRPAGRSYGNISPHTPLLDPMDIRPNGHNSTVASSALQPMTSCAYTIQVTPTVDLLQLSNDRPIKGSGHSVC